MTDIDTNELRKLAEAATRGPWVADGPIVYVDAGIQPHVCEALVIDTDATYIAAANPTTILALLDRLAAMTERAEKAERGLRILLECTVAERDRIYGDAMAKLRAELARRTVERDSHCEHANQESARASDYAETNEALRTRLAEVERERDDALAKLDAMTNQAVMLSGRRSTIVDVSERDAILSEIAHALDIPDASLPSILGAIAGSDTVISQLQAEVKRLREAMPSAWIRDSLEGMLGEQYDEVRYQEFAAWLARLDAAGGGAK